MDEQRLDDKRLGEIRERATRTWDVLVQTMKRTPPVIGTSIPARPNDDLDLLVGSLTDDVKALLSELSRLTRERDLLARECGAARKLLDENQEAMVMLVPPQGQPDHPLSVAVRKQAHDMCAWLEARELVDAAGVKVEG